MSDALVNPASGEADTAPLVERWDFEKEYQARKAIYEKACQDLTTILTRLIDDLAKEGLFRARVDPPRVKGPMEVKEKAERQDIPLREVFDRLHDIVGTRIVCNNLEDIDKVIETVRMHPRLTEVETDPPERATIGDDRGYRGRNMVVRLIAYEGYKEVEVPAEIQVRTLLQDAWGDLSHEDFYKPKGPRPPTWLDEQMKELSDRLHELDRHAQAIRGAVEKRYIDLKRSLGKTIASKIADKDAEGAFRAISESLLSTDPGVKLSAIETFIDNPTLWNIGMQDFAANVPGMNEWLKIRLMDKLCRIDPEEISQFDPVITALTGG